jgi:hypothetical protein
MRLNGEPSTSNQARVRNSNPNSPGFALANSGDSEMPPGDSVVDIFVTGPRHKNTDQTEITEQKG